MMKQGFSMTFNDLMTLKELINVKCVWLAAWPPSSCSSSATTLFPSSWFDCRQYILWIQILHAICPRKLSFFQISFFLLQRTLTGFTPFFMQFSLISSLPSLFPFQFPFPCTLILKKYHAHIIFHNIYPWLQVKPNHGVKQIVELVALLGINAAVFYLFLYRPFGWDNAPGQLQRFMW